MSNNNKSSLETFTYSNKKKKVKNTSKKKKKIIIINVLKNLRMKINLYLQMK